MRTLIGPLFAIDGAWRRMAIAMLILLSPGMANAQSQPADPATAAASQAAVAPAAASQDYKLGVGDKVRIIVYNEPTLSGEFAVSDAGTLSLPLIGDVPANGRSVREIIANVEQLLGDGYLKQPKVSLDVLTYRPFYILGEVAKPGEYPYSTGLTVMNAVARAEGFTYRANKRKVFIKHAGRPEEMLIKLTPDLAVQPGDTIRVGERYF